MTADVASALIAMGSSATREQARGWLNVAILRGLRMDQAAAVMRLWDARRAAETVTLVAEVDDTRPAPDDRCVHCAGWGYFPDVDGEGLDGDVPCGHCSETGIEP